ncbi:MAG: squalene/phytoene synthase family protein [Pyrinomonadaceae bacterium]|nr:squalene/phytoene synthase family protein [Phycisphaerales bacterium]
MDAAGTAIHSAHSSHGLRAIEVPAAPASMTSRAVPTLRGVSDADLATGYAECAQITKQRARNFYYGLRLTPEPRRSAIYSIYAWMRAADDAADAQDTLSAKRLKLAEYGEMTERVLRGDSIPPDAPRYWLGVAATIHSYPIDPSLFHDMLDGLVEDLSHDGYDTDEELWRYCYRVASTVGLVCISIWGLTSGADPHKARELSIRRGQAFQRTNILRDFAEDFDASPGRVYLPKSSFGAANLTALQVRQWSDPVRCEAYVAEQAQIARAEYAASAGLEAMIDPACAPTLWAMTRIYSDILKLIEENPCRVVESRRIRLAAPRKAGIALRASWRARRGKWDL